MFSSHAQSQSSNVRTGQRGLQRALLQRLRRAGLAVAKAQALDRWTHTSRAAAKAAASRLAVGCGEQRLTRERATSPASTLNTTWASGEQASRDETTHKLAYGRCGMALSYNTTSTYAYCYDTIIIITTRNYLLVNYLLVNIVVFRRPAKTFRNSG